VAASQTREEKRFTEPEVWRSSIVRGRVVRAQRPNGYVLATDAGEVAFFPAKPDPDGPPQANLAVRASVEPLRGDLGYCSPFPAGTYHCVTLHAGVETQIPEGPVGRPAIRPSVGGKPAFAPFEILVRPRGGRRKQEHR
jgi:hypothetical protein